MFENDITSQDSRLIQAQFRLDLNTKQKSGVTSNDGNSFCLDVDFNIPGKGITAIFGHSGSGKTSLLRCIAGLESALLGNLTVNGETWQDNHHFLPTHKRSIAYVFQEPSLFTHLTVQENLAFAIKRSRPSKGKKSNTKSSEKLSQEPNGLELYEQVVDIMGIESILSKMPNALSGGESQRVAIARALLIKPRLLLMDEPLASLDDARKQEILPYLITLKNTFDMPIIYVSHSLDEVSRLADHLILLDNGAIIAQGDVQSVFSRLDLPINFSEEAGVVLQGKVESVDNQWHLATLNIDGGEVFIPNNHYNLGQNVRIRILAKDISLAIQSYEDSSILNKLPVKVVEISKDHGTAMALVSLKIGSNVLIARLTRKSVHQLNIEKGKQVWAQIKSIAIVQ